jgi:hypothetical protein
LPFSSALRLVTGVSISRRRTSIIALVPNSAAGIVASGGCRRRFGTSFVARGSGSAVFGAFEQMLGTFGHGSSVDTGVKWGERESFVMSTGNRTP